MSGTLFQMGELMFTPGAVEALAGDPTEAARLLRRHLSGDFGVLDAHDVAVNRRAIRDGGTVHSAYILASGVKIYIVTEPDRSATTFLLPDEY